ncbi:MAG TPA: response regulator transcription factor [Tepidisphaeraceae bacterium]
MSVDQAGHIEHGREVGRVRVLLVDDHPILRQGMAAMINEEPDLVVCGEADGVRSAIAIAGMTHPQVALVDLSIADGDGLELIRDLRNRFPEIRTLVLSMYDEIVYAERALRAGARGYVMKAEAAKTVMAGIRSVLRGEIYLSEQMSARLAGSERRQAEVPPAAGIQRLSDREFQVLRCIGQGMSTREIAEDLFISVKTVEAHREHIKQKLGLMSSGELLRYAIEHNRLNG